jgi:hypothetical protein
MRCSNVAALCTHDKHHKHHHKRPTRNLLLALRQQIPRRGLVLLCWVAHAEAVLRAREAGLAGAAEKERLALPAQRVVYNMSDSQSGKPVFYT